MVATRHVLTHDAELELPIRGAKCRHFLAALYDRNDVLGSTVVQLGTVFSTVPSVGITQDGTERRLLVRHDGGG